MSFIMKKDLVLLKEQLKSTYKVLYNTFKDLDWENLNSIKIERARHQLDVMSSDCGTYKNIKDIKNRKTQGFKLLVADEKPKMNHIGREMRVDIEKNYYTSSRIINIR